MYLLNTNNNSSRREEGGGFPRSGFPSSSFACLFLQQMLLSCFRFDCASLVGITIWATQFQFVGAWKDDLLSRIIFCFPSCLLFCSHIWNANSRPNCRDLKIIVEIHWETKSLLLQQSYLLLCFKEIFAFVFPNSFKIAAEQQQCSQIVQMMPHQPFLHGKDMMICLSSWREPVKIQTLWVQQLLQKH